MNCSFFNGDPSGDKVGIGSRRSPHNRAAPSYLMLLVNRGLRAMTVLSKHRNSLGKDWAVRENDKCRGSTKEVTLFTLSSSCFFHGN